MVQTHSVGDKMENKQAIKKLKEIENGLSKEFEQLSEISLFNQQKVLNAFIKNKIALTDFACSSGYGYDDVGKTKLSKLFADAFSAQAAIASPLLTCGTHTLSTALFGILRPGDLFVSIGDVYDTLGDIIKGKNNGSLAEWGVKYSKLKFNGRNEEFDGLKKQISVLMPKLVFIQRSRGYTKRKNGYSISELKELISLVKSVSPKIIVMVDNCYGEFTEKKEPTEVGADIIAGSLIKNPGGGLAPTGGYIAGKKKLINMIAGRFTAPSLGTEVGSYNASYQPFFEGFFVAPHTVSRVLKGSMLLEKTLGVCGIKSTPNGMPHDIVRSIEFGNKEKLIEFIQSVQKLSPVDSHILPLPWAMPGYDNEVIMAAGTFVQGSSIELSCDAPIKAPYIAYIQGGLTYEHIQILCLDLLQKLA